MNFLSFFMESIQAANRMRTQSPLAGLQTAEQLINNYCDGDSATQLQSNPAHNAATSHPHGASLAPQTDLIEKSGRSKRDITEIAPGTAA